MDTNIHNVKNIEIEALEHHPGQEFWTREIVVLTEEGQKFTLTLYMQSKENGAIVLKDYSPPSW